MSTRELSVANVEALSSLKEEIKACFVEYIFNARQEVIQAHHETGKLLHEYVKQYKVKITLLVKQLVDDGDFKETTLWLCYKFYETYPKLNDVDKLGFGKNISWNKIRSAIAPEKKEECLHEKLMPAHQCAGCKKFLTKV